MAYEASPVTCSPTGSDDQYARLKEIYKSLRGLRFEGTYLECRRSHPAKVVLQVNSPDCVNETLASICQQLEDARIWTGITEVHGSYRLWVDDHHLLNHKGETYTCVVNETEIYQDPNSNYCALVKIRVDVETATHPTEPDFAARLEEEVKKIYKPFMGVGFMAQYIERTEFKSTGHYRNLWEVSFSSRETTAALDHIERTIYTTELEGWEVRKLLWDGMTRSPSGTVLWTNPTGENYKQGRLYRCSMTSVETSHITVYDDMPNSKIKSYKARVSIWMDAVELVDGGKDGKVGATCSNSYPIL